MLSRERSKTNETSKFKIYPHKSSGHLWMYLCILNFKSAMDYETPKVMVFVGISNRNVTYLIAYIFNRDLDNKK